LTFLYDFKLYLFKFNFQNYSILPEIEINLPLFFINSNFLVIITADYFSRRKIARCMSKQNRLRETASQKNVLFEK